MKLILSTINGAGANKVFVARATAPQKYNLKGSGSSSGSSKIGWLHGSALRLRLRLPSPGQNCIQYKSVNPKFSVSICNGIIYGVHKLSLVKAIFLDWSFSTDFK